MKFGFLFLSFFIGAGFAGFCQYAPQVPLTGNTGIAQSDSVFVDWAAACTVQRGWLNIADKSLGQPTLGADSDATGFPGSSIVSLGDSGVAVLTFNYNIYNGTGPDFAVFENGFADPQNDTVAYLELAFVEVSSDGIRYVRFPASSAMQDSVQIDNFTYTDASKYNNLAGKYISGFGTPFDLDELKDSVGLDVNHISHVRIVDVIGSIDTLYGSRDHNGNIINEAYPSPYSSGGFDLNGLGVIHSLKPTAVKELNKNLLVQIYPNPVQSSVYISCPGLSNVKYKLTDLSGREMYAGAFSEQTALSFNGTSKGVYLLYLEHGSDRSVRKIIKD
jgi:hypothetical protein